VKFLLDHDAPEEVAQLLRYWWLLIPTFLYEF